MSKVTVNLEQLITFFDHDKDAHAYSSGIKAMAGEELGFALLIEFLRREGKTATLLPGPVTTGSRSGPRLDGWVQVRGGQEPDVDYQVEVKSWSIHGYGGYKTPLEFGCPPQKLAEHKRRVWKHYWDNGQFRPEALKKVLIPMNHPPDSTAAVQPLACIWDAVHPTGESDPFFVVKTARGSMFESVAVFSMSGFLRRLNEKTLMLDMPMTSERIRRLGSIFELP